MAIEKRRSEKSGRLTFLPRVKDPEGRWYKTAAFPTLELAKEEEGRLFKLRRKGQRVSPAEGRKYVTDDYFDVWIIENTGECSDGWKISLRQMYRDYVQPVIGKIKVADVGTPDIGRLLNRVSELGRSPQQKKHVYSLVRRMFGDAQDYYGMVAENPVKPRFHCPRVPKAKPSYLAPLESVKLLETARRHPYMGAAVWLQLLAGLRTEAMQALTWDCVDFRNDQIEIRRAWKAKVRRIEEYPKGKDYEFVPLVPELKEYLGALWAAAGHDRTAFVCQGPKGGMLSRDTYDGALARLCAQAGVPVMTPHGLRHSTSELFVERGASNEDLRRLYNHKDGRTTSRYIHRTGGRLPEIASRVRLGLRVIEGGSTESSTSVEEDTYVKGSAPFGVLNN